MTENQAREEICRIGLSLFDRGLVHGTAGNISVRLDDGFLITPTDACLGRIDPARLARLDAGLRQTGGDRASKTMALHARIYAASLGFDPGTRCVIHTHATHCVALTLAPLAAGAEAAGDRRRGAGLDAAVHGDGDGAGDRAADVEAASPHREPAAGASDAHRELLPALTPYFVMKVGRVPLISYGRPGSAQAAEAVAQAIERYGRRGTPIRAVMLERLGPLVWHDSAAAAMATLEELEETARLQLLTGGRAPPLQADGIDELRSSFGARW